MKFLGILEKAWLAAIVIAFGMGIYNAVTLQALTYRVYTPFVCGGFCILIYMNIRRQRLFVENMKKEQEKKNATPPQPSPE
jgi:hypothetical protein